MNKYGLDSITKWPHKVPIRRTSENGLRSAASRRGLKVSKDRFNKVYLITKR